MLKIGSVGRTLLNVIWWKAKEASVYEEELGKREKVKEGCRSETKIKSGAMFSHIGGLLGYWLGISVFTFLDIIEKSFVTAIIWRRRFKKHKAQKTPNSDDLV
ncbi:hypothetical protein AVEN_257264-1 [Araneus ventricosus]|uniref:Uncharacterized protein n=1 Tax=Araneus ventricosus TaxID=182803 RepID=A0A4Y2HBK5_ARAVE|nr:hypothetical protein AVEN_257264-1 [Araneus ventricosus]